MTTAPPTSTLLDSFLHTSDIDFSNLTTDIGNNQSPALTVRSILQNSKEIFDDMFIQGADPEQLIRLKSWLVDQILAALWNKFDLGSNLSLIAVGGYGRSELHPHSDIDLLMLAKEPIDDTIGQSLTQFITLLFDLKLDIGHSVRTIDECIEAAKEDVTIATNLLETRTIIGNSVFLEEMSSRIYSDEVYTSKAYFLAKREEQAARHEKYGGSEYNLEPNLKSSPGTLRDIQTITWITKRHFGPDATNSRARYHFLNDEEFKMFTKGELFLWRLRYGLQMIADRNENRLLFDHQRKLAEILGYKNDKHKLGVEKMMQRYYRVVLGLAELADVIFQYFDDFYLSPDKKNSIKVLNNRFQLNNGYLEAITDDVFDRAPYALIELFLFKAQDPSIKGIKSTTIRLAREHQTLINKKFRNDIANTTLFMDILRTPHDLHRTLGAMLKYSFLGRYLPKFGLIIGQMQHDLFHAYTVDAHTLKLIENIVNLEKPAAQKDFPLASRLLRHIPKRELLFVTAIHHDIAKGRGGNHSQLGAVDAIEFCKLHHFSERDTKLVSWLIQNHLIMSITAQKRDLADPDIIHQFSQQMPSLMHLEYLYILTVCDIAATNENLWNSWRSSLLQLLYRETRRAIRRGADNPIDRDDWIKTTKQATHALLLQQEFSASNIDSLLDSLEDEYFLQDSTTEIAWQASAILKHGESTEPLVIIRDADTSTGDGYSRIMIYLKSKQGLFAATTAVFEQMNLNVLDAQISDSGKQFGLSNFVVIDAQGQSLSDNPQRKERIHLRLIEELDDPNDYPEIIQRRTPRQLKQFSFPTEVTMSNNMLSQRTILEVITPDRPGLLARIGQILLEYNLSLINAKIATLGERVEDVFCIAAEDGGPISDAKLCESLRQDICKQLDEQVASQESLQS